ALVEAAPHRRVDLFPRDDALSVANEEREHVELLPRQANGLSAAPDGARLEVDLDVAEAEHLRTARSTKERLDASEELPHAEGLRELVIGAATKAFDLLVLRPARAQDEHGKLGEVAAKPSQHVEAIEPRKHAIEDDEVDALVRKEHASLLAV